MQKSLLAIAVTAVLATLYLVNKVPSEIQNYEQIVSKFNEFQQIYNKAYPSMEETFYRFKVFADNLNFIQKLQESSNETEFGITQYMDLTNEEYSKLFLQESFQVQQSNSNHAKLQTGNNPASIDWRTEGYITAVGNAGENQIGYAFAIADSLSAAYDQAGLGALVPLSKQQIIDCVSPTETEATTEQTWQFIKNSGITSEQKYPFKGTKQTCNQKTGEFSITSFSTISTGDAEALQAAVALRPVVVGVDARLWQYYVSGIFYACQSQINHYALVVGYNSTAWFVKNSQGTTFGQNGYINLKMGNTCGIANQASYPTI